MRLATLLIVVAGCDLVFTLPDEPGRLPPPIGVDESTTHDEDGDGTVDRNDLCPHLATAGGDRDGDRIGDDCDRDADDPGDLRFFFSFEKENVEPLKIVGSQMIVDDGLLIGDDANSRDVITLDVATSEVVVELRATIETTAVEGGNPDDRVFVELGLFTVHRGFNGSDGLTDSGDSCFVGRTSKPGNNQPNYLELGEDAARVADQRREFDGQLRRRTLTMAAARDPARFTCEVALSDGSRLSGELVPALPADTAGAIAVTTTHLSARLDYLWIVIRSSPESP